MWSKVPWKDFHALTCSLLSVNILFQWPSLTCHICSVVYPLTLLLKGKVYLKHAWSDLLFPTAGTGHDQKSVLSYRVTLTKGETKEKKEKANRASIKILPLKGILKCNDAPLCCIYFNLSYCIPFLGKLVWGTWKHPFASLHNISFVSEHIQNPKHRQPSRHPDGSKVRTSMTNCKIVLMIPFDRFWNAEMSCMSLWIWKRIKINDSRPIIVLV